MKYVYVMQIPPLIKVGVSRHPRKRQKAWIEAELVYAFESCDAEAVEAKVKSTLKHACAKGEEWFSLSQEKVIEAVEEAAKSISQAHPYGAAPQSFRDVLKQLQGWRTRDDLRVEINELISVEEKHIGYWTLVGWEKSNNIPRKHWETILSLAAKRGRIDINRELLKKLAVERGMPKQGRPKDKA